jgi:hypothetical protein
MGNRHGQKEAREARSSHVAKSQADLDEVVLAFGFAPQTLRVW